MRRISKTINAEPFRIPSSSIRTVTEHSGAKQRRNVDIVVTVRQMKTIARVGDRELGVTSVDVVAGKFSFIAKVFAVGSTIRAVAVGPAEPRNSDPISNCKSVDAFADLFDVPDDL